MPATPTTPYLRVDLDRLRRNVAAAAEWAAGEPGRAAPARQDPQVARDRPAAARAGRGRADRGHARRGRGVRPARLRRPVHRLPGLAWTSAPPSGCATSPSAAGIAIGVDSVEGAARAGRLLGAVRRGGGRRGGQRPAPHRLPARGGRRGGRGRDAGRAAGARRVHLPRPQLRTRRGRPRRRTRPAPWPPRRARWRARGSRSTVVSGGSTPSLAHLDTGVVTEARPGVYVFGDAQQWELGAMPPESTRPDLPRHRGQPHRRPRRARRRQQGARGRPRGVQHRLRAGCSTTPTPGSCSSRSTTRSSTSPARALPRVGQPGRRRAQPLLRRGQPGRRPLGRGARLAPALAGGRPGPERLTRPVYDRAPCEAPPPRAPAARRPPPWPAAATTAGDTAEDSGDRRPADRLAARPKDVTCDYPADPQIPAAKEDDPPPTKPVAGGEVRPRSRPRSATWGSPSTPTRRRAPSTRSSRWPSRTTSTPPTATG